MLDAQPVIPIETPAVNWVKKPYVKGLYPNLRPLRVEVCVYRARPCEVGLWHAQHDGLGHCRFPIADCRLEDARSSSI